MRNPLQVLAAHGRWNLPSKPTAHGWKRLPPAHAQHTLTGMTGETIVLPPAALTAMGRHDAGSPYWLAADAAGRALIYHNTHGRAVRTLGQTAAAKREATRTMTSKTTITFPNVVHAVAGRGSHMVLWTAQELQALDTTSGETTWQIDLQCHKGNAAAITAAAAATQCLDWHPTRPRLLWQKPVDIQPIDDYQGVCGSEEENATLFLLDCSTTTTSTPTNINSNGRCRVQFRALPPLQETTSQSHAVVWDTQNTDALLQVATVADDVWELRRIHADTGNVLDRTTLAKGAGHATYAGCRIRQAADYLFLCTARGIRCFDAQRLTFLTVYGETVALHGKTVGWQDCFWLPEPHWPHTVWQAAKTGTAGAGGSAGGLGAGGGMMSKDSSSASKTPVCLLSTQDELARRRAVRQTHAANTLSRSNSDTAAGSNNTTTATTTVPQSNPTATTSPTSSKNLFSNMLLVGIPHPHRGPTELQSTLYVWKPGQVLPLTTLQAPPGGLLGVHMSADPVHGWHLTAVSATTGEAYEWGASLQSDFSGNMYPTHYQVIDDNVEYLEDEDELDKGGIISSNNGSVKDDASTTAVLTQDEEDLQRALRESLDDNGNVKIDVLNTDDENANPFATCFPAWPDASLRPRSSSFSKALSQQSSPSRFRKAEPELFAGFPQLDAVRQARQEVTPAPASSANGNGAPHLTDTERLAILNKATKGKRSRTANVEVVLQASIDPELKQQMAALHRKWSDGRGSGLRPVRRTAEEKALALELLLLGPTSRSNTPTDKDGCKSTKPVLLPPPAPSSSGGMTTNGKHGKLKQGTILATKELKEPPEPSQILSTSNVDPVKSESHANKKQQGPAAVCPACWGRMVIHACGKRAKPVDVEALERAEEERKAAEEAEKLRIKVEKRRAAEAKRREARKKKKEEEERQRREEELQRLEEERVAAMQRVEEPPSSAYSPYSSLDTHRKIPRYADLMSAPVNKGENDYSFGYAAARGNGSHCGSNNNNSDRAKETYARQTSGVGSEGSAYSSGSFTAAAVEPLFKPEETTPLDEPTYHRPSFQAASLSLTASISKPLSSSGSDALAVLAGLADQQSTQDTGHYDYSGAEERRRAILNQYHTSLTETTEEQSFSVYDRPASYTGYRYSSTSTRETDSQHAASNGGAGGEGLTHYIHPKPKTDDS